MQYIDCTINPITRQVSYPGAVIVQRDTNVEALRFHYSLQAEHELENDSIRVMVKTGKEIRGFNAENVRVETNDGGDEELVFEHTITRYETEVPGQINVSVCGNQISGNTITEAWHTLNMSFQVGSSVHTDSDEGEDSEETQASNAEKIAALQTLVDAITSGRPIPVDLKSKMVDTSAIYLYTGNEQGEQHNYWYYHDGTSWVPGSEYGGITVDDELSATSENPVQNKVIKANFDQVNGRLQQVNYAVINNDLLRAATWNQGFVKSNGTLTPATSSATYNYSDMIPVEEGERYKYALDASSGTLIIAAYESADDESAVTAKSVRGTDGMASGTYVVPNGVNYIRITLRVTDYASEYFYKRTSLTEMGTRMTAVENNMTGLSADVEELKERQAGFVYNNNIRRACVCFQFDDATTPANPNAIKALFTERGYHVGWVLPTHDNTDTPISEEVITRHLGYQADGDEIICHGKNHTIDWTDTTQTDAQIDTYLKESKATLESYGFIINGFVPTMSAMAAKFRYLMRRYYQYGYSVYIGAYNGTQRSFSYPTDGVYNLWRVAMDSTTLENTKAALDAAIAAGGCITFYGHPLYYNNASYKLTTANITGLLDYVKAKEQAGEIVVDVPGKTVRNFFDVRNDDVVQDWIPVSISNIDLHENMESPMIWAVYYSRKFNLLSLDCRLRPTLNITGDAVLFKLPVKVGLNNIMVTDELGLPIKVVNATVGSEVRLVGESATWTRSTMDRLHLMCTLSMAAAQMW